MRKRIFFMLCSILFILGACGKSSNIPSASGKKLEHVSLMLDWYPNAVHSFLFVAQEKGYFNEQGLDVDIKMPADTNDPLRLVAAGKIDIAISYQPEVLVARNEKIPIQSFAAIVRHPLNQLMVPATSSIQSPKDLVGKTIGYPSIPLDEAIIHTMVKSDGGDPNKVKMVDIGWDLIPAIATKKTDALIGGFINHEKILLEKEGHPMRALNPADYGVPDYYELVLVGSEKEVKTRSKVFNKFMKAAAKGQKFVTDHPEEGLSILLNHEDQSSPLDKNIETKSLKVLLPLMDEKGKPFGYQEGKKWIQVSEWLKESKVINKNVNPTDAYINIGKS